MTSHGHRKDDARRIKELSWKIISTALFRRLNECPQERDPGGQRSARPTLSLLRVRPPAPILFSFIA